MRRRRKGVCDRKGLNHKRGIGIIFLYDDWTTCIDRGGFLKINYLRIINFKSIRDMEIEDIEDALILVGKNNTGKTVVMDAVRLAAQPEAQIDVAWFNEPGCHIKIIVELGFTMEDLAMFYENGDCEPI